MKRLISFCALFAMASMLAFAADVSGKWVGEAGAKGGPPTFNFKQDGSALTGSQEGRQGAVEISNGKVDGDNVSFEVTREFNGNSVTIKYSGTVSDNTMKLNAESPRGSREMTLTKQ
ncbi:MAG: hypothetical protein ACRD30_06135 [Bryobacteraceae bacterium]